MDALLSPFITSQWPYWTAFLAGLFGGVHCIGMCGGVVGALTFGLPTEVRLARWRVLPYLFAYNGGRILTYTGLGILIGWLGGIGGDALSEYAGWVYLRLLAAGFMILLGLYIGGWWFGLLRVERLGGGLWTRLQPFAQKLLPIRTPQRAFAVGALWGFLPCGLIYSVLIWALAAGGWQEGGLFMLSFGLGTLPTLLGAGLVSARFGQVLQAPNLRRVAGALVIVFGVWTLVATLQYQPNVGLGCVPVTP
ncbi:MAG: sulfite exporter TauE/SafE family protein [Gammaproteobacteria bacterium]|nr:sulfite exporter TauE/SafE family protein [Gammaproteobacteria bacterium]